MLKFNRSNAKLDGLELRTGRKVYTFSLLSGWSCPFAKDCLSKVYEIDGKLTLKDGPDTQFRCFSASQEVLFPSVYRQRKANFDALRVLNSADDMAALIMAHLPKGKGYIMRIHVGGDFFNANYFMAWAKVAKQRPDVLFYAYTKSLGFWVKNKAEIDAIDNFVLTASFGGRMDDYIAEHALRFAKVVYSKYQARKAKLPIDHDDSHATVKNGSFALLLHGVQPKGSKASKALSKLKGVGSYSRKAKVNV
jgi:hypothetical protein